MSGGTYLCRSSIVGFFPSPTFVGFTHARLSPSFCVAGAFRPLSLLRQAHFSHSLCGRDSDPGRSLGCSVRKDRSWGSWGERVKSKADTGGYMKLKERWMMLNSLALATLHLKLQILRDLQAPAMVMVVLGVVLWDLWAGLWWLVCNVCQVVAEGILAIKLGSSLGHGLKIKDLQSDWRTCI